VRRYVSARQRAFGADSTAVPSLPARWEVRSVQSRQPRAAGGGEIGARVDDAWQQSGLRVAIPGDPELPTQRDDLGDARPLLLWLHGTADLRLTCVRSVSMVGSRAATGYGNLLGIEMAAALADHGVSIISGGAKATDSQLALGLWESPTSACRQRHCPPPRFCLVCGVHGYRPPGRLVRHPGRSTSRG
jgi:predicted Rossmann fold nucleotide-binding protein DprA/Smf involved in DNA uptake